MSDSLSGRWRGVFSYPGEMTPIAFEAELHERDGSLTGLIHEVDGDGRGSMAFTAVVEGNRNGSEVDFRKTYDDFDPICLVDYWGTLDEEANEITGEWVRLDDYLSGSFVMRRDSSAAQTERQLAAEELTSDR